MSSNREDIQLVLDNRCNVSKTTHALVKVSGNNVNYFEVQADTQSSYESIINFNSIITPSLASTVISRNPRIRYTVTIIVDETAGGAAAFPNANFYPVLPSNVLNDSRVVNTTFRAFPLQSCTSTLSITINGATTTLNSRQILDFLQRRLDKDWVYQQATECPSSADNLCGLIVDGSPAIAAGVMATAAPTNGVLQSLTITNANNGTITAINGVALAAANAGLYTINLASTSNPHSNQVLSTFQNGMGGNRASFKPELLSGANTARTYTFDISEPLLISPFTTYDNETFLANINTMSMTFNLQNLKDMLVSAYVNNAGTIQGYNPACIGNIGQISAGNAFQVSNARLEWEYIQVPQDLVTIPPIVSYPYENVVYFQKSITNVNFANNVKSGIQSDTIRFNAQPDLIAVYVRNPIQNRTGLSNTATWLTDTFYNIGALGNGGNTGSVSVNYGVKSGQLSSASTKSLYRMSKRNGLNVNWNEWTNGQCVLLINPTLDLGLDLQAGDVLPMEAASNQNFQIQLTINNLAQQYSGVTTPTELELMVVPIYKGVINITPNSALYNLGELSHSEVQQALQTQPKDGRMVSEEVVKPTVQGGSLFGTLKSVVGSTANALKSDLGQKALGAVASLTGKRR